MVYGELCEMSKAPVFTGISELRTYLDSHGPGKSLGFVPTMGALHQGHLDLVARSSQENELTIVSIYVNPIQFGPNEDFSKYPRPLSDDIAKLSPFNCIVFTPSDEEMTLGINDYSFHPRRLGQIWEGESRPTHFDGVCKIVMKLFQVVRPTRAYFGEKDFQQFVIIQDMARTFAVPVEVVPCPTIRESDGLAMSSRNRYLSTEERKFAAEISKNLRKVCDAFYQNPKMSGSELVTLGHQLFTNTPEIKLDYLAIVDEVRLTEVTEKITPGNRIIVAVRIGTTRLIDNVAV